jgi:hypothetical protein
MIPSDRWKNSAFRTLLGAALLVSAGGAVAQSFTNIIDPLNTAFTQALGINDSGTIVGYGNSSTFNGFTLTLRRVSRV